jgi:hypothetical protein
MVRLGGGGEWMFCNRLVGALFSRKRYAGRLDFSCPSVLNEFVEGSIPIFHTNQLVHGVFRATFTIVALVDSR